jgi:hypothetical protein
MIIKTMMIMLTMLMMMMMTMMMTIRNWLCVSISPESCLRSQSDWKNALGREVKRASWATLHSMGPRGSSTPSMSPRPSPLLT